MSSTQTRTPQPAAEPGSYVTGPNDLPRARRGLRTPVDWGPIRALSAQLERIAAHIEDIEQRLEAPVSLREALRFAVQRISERAGDEADNELRFRSTVYQEHAELIALIPEADLVDWSDFTFELEEEAMNLFFEDEDYSLEIHVQRP